MIKVLGDYHTHTIYSSGLKKRGTHATGTIRENAESALSKGLSTIVISEHGPGHYVYGVKRSNLHIMKEEIKRLNEEFEPKGLKILLGVESNLVGIDGRLDVTQEDIKLLDILLMGYHYGAMPRSVGDLYGLYVVNPVSKIIKSTDDKARDINTKAYLKAIDNYKIDIITHPGSKAGIHIRDVAEKAAKAGTSLEISSKHSELSVDSLRKIQDLDIRFYINSDAHRPGDVGNIQRGIDKALEAGIDLRRVKNILEIR